MVAIGEINGTRDPPAICRDDDRCCQEERKCEKKRNKVKAMQLAWHCSPLQHVQNKGYIDGGPLRLIH